MTKTLDKTELVRLAWLTELRRQGHRQCTGSYKSDGDVCALGLLLDVVGLSADWAEQEANDERDVGALAGLSGDQSRTVVCMNDGLIPAKGTSALHQHTFAEIADVVEGWFK